MTQLEQELGQLIRKWTSDAEYILRGVNADDDYEKGYGHGIRQAAQELRSFMWDRFCRDGVAEALAGMMYHNGGQ